MINEYFNLKKNRTNIRTELFAGLTTFLTMSYIIFVQPAVLSGAMFGLNTGMDFGAVTTATCLAAALATGIMALYARYPIAQAPGMGENFFFVFSVVLPLRAAGVVNAWQTALGVVFVSGVLFLILSLGGLRQAIVEAMTRSMKNAVAVGIGLFIAFIGLKNAGVILENPGTALKLNPNLASPDLIVFFAGLLVAGALYARRVPGSILWGILSATSLACLLKTLIPHLPEAIAAAPVVAGSKLMTQFEFASRVIAAPPALTPTFLKMDINAALTLSMFPFVLIFLFMDLFDTVGTLVGVAERAGLAKGGKIPRIRRALLSDAVGTVAGACLGTSTVTSYIESAAGVEQGGRTGLTSLTVAALFLLALIFSPLIAMVGSYPPVTAPALVVVGALMLRSVVRIDWADPSESLPAFLIMAGIPLTFSIADGLALGFICYPIIKFLAGRGREVNWLMYFMAAVLLAYFVLVRAAVG
jgi:AGZA family xanthine/uracil permease-like MFS transporter